MRTNPGSPHPSEIWGISEGCCYLIAFGEKISNVPTTQGDSTVNPTAADVESTAHGGIVCGGLSPNSRHQYSAFLHREST